MILLLDVNEAKTLKRKADHLRAIYMGLGINEPERTREKFSADLKDLLFEYGLRAACYSLQLEAAPSGTGFYLRILPGDAMTAVLLYFLFS